MNKKYRLSVALDIDDLLMECTSYAIALANEKHQFDPPMTIYEKDRWGKVGTRADAIYPYFSDGEFYRTQPVYEGAKEFVRKLSQMTEVFISTAIPPECMGIRAQRIMEEFPEIPADHIYMGSRKDKIDVDILFDDGLHNVAKSTAAYPILMRRPWNQEATGLLAVNNYDEFLKLVETIADSYSTKQEQLTLDRPGIVVLVGPSGSGKTEVAKKLMRRKGKFEKLISYTTDKKAATQQEDWYHYVPDRKFHEMCESGQMFESTTYANHSYGSRKSDVEAILAQGKHVLTVMDICGAMAMKTHFDHVITIYIKRDKKELLTAILEKRSSTADKVNRLLAIEAETKNAQICDYIVRIRNCQQTVEQICKRLDISMNSPENSD